jgi:hypothetical protein
MGWRKGPNSLKQPRSRQYYPISEGRKLRLREEVTKPGLRPRACVNG